MRDYGKISPQFWIGETGKRLRGDTEAQVIAAYLVSCPHANMIGLFYLPLTFMAHETGLSIEGASKALRRVEEAGFCSYDEDSEVVWVYEMAKFQIADKLKAADNRCQGIAREYESVPNNKHLRAFFDRYKRAFHLENPRGNDDENASPLEAPSEPLGSQEQEQEQEQEKDKAPRERAARKTKIPPDFGITPETREWARAEGHEPHLEAHLAYFRDYAASSGKTYADWDRAFRNCIRADWGSVRKIGALLKRHDDQFKGVL